MIAASYTETGKKHNKNQDSCYISCEEDKGIFIVADGMGGHAAGDIASKTAIEVIKENLTKYSEKTLKEALKKANLAVYEKSKSQAEFEGMGTTIAMCLIEKNKIIAAHIGDSRLYVIENGEIVYVTKDHSYVQQLVEQGEISEEEAKKHPMKNIITNALGVETDVLTDTEILKRKNGYIVICSDGVSNVLDEGQIIEIITKNKPEKAAKLLCSKAAAAGSTDDLTSIVIDLRGERL